MRPIHGFAILASGVLACGLLVFVAGSAAGEGALHPRILPVPLVCPSIDRAGCKTVEIQGIDGARLRAWYFQPAAGNGGAVIALHGIGASREQAAGLARLFLPSGYSILTPDLRGHGESGGIASYGVLEAGDVHSWAEWLLRSHPLARLYGIGESLGGSVLLQSLSLEPRFRAVIAESPYSDFPAVARERVARLLPSGAGWLASPVVFSGLTWTQWRYGIDLRRTSSVDAVRETHVPVLLIHGLADNLTSAENSRRIAAANPAVELWLVPKAGHTGAWAAAQREFESRVRGWFAAH
jgi:uncharacterized protein